MCAEGYVCACEWLDGNGAGKGVAVGVGRSDGMCVCVCVCVYVEMLLYLHLRSDQVILSGRQVGRHFKTTRSNSHSCRH